MQKLNTTQKKQTTK